MRIRESNVMLENVFDLQELEIGSLNDLPTVTWMPTELRKNPLYVRLDSATLSFIQVYKSAEHKSNQTARQNFY